MFNKLLLYRNKDNIKVLSSTQVIFPAKWHAKWNQSIIVKSENALVIVLKSSILIQCTYIIAFSQEIQCKSISFCSCQSNNKRNNCTHRGKSNLHKISEVKPQIQFHLGQTSTILKVKFCCCVPWNSPDSTKFEVWDNIPRCHLLHFKR